MTGCTIEYMSDWIIANRVSTAFEGYSKEKIAQQILEGITNKTCCYIFGKDSLIGVCFGKPNNDTKEFFITDILTTEHGVVKQMMKYFMTRWPNYFITGTHRTGRTVLFNNPSKLTERL
jgi:hypothetical protein